MPERLPDTVQCCPKRVLVVDDNRDLAETLSAVLGICGHYVEVAFNGLEAVDKARSFVPDVVICDLGMPLLDGFGVARTLRCDPRLSRARLIALTAYELEKDARTAGFDHFLLKPADLGDVTRLVAD